MESQHKRAKKFRAHQHFSRLVVNIILNIIVKVLCFLTVTGALYKICIESHWFFRLHSATKTCDVLDVNCFGLRDRKAKALEV